jgi:DNA helicase-2/ATP-dependent DNA helicase PcrA
MQFALNEPQARAVAHASGPLLVFAGAGSGKTRVITFRVANLLATHHVAPYRILTVTFTNKAAGELKHRLTELAGDGVVGDLWVGTFHSICAKLLRRHHAEVGLERSFTIYDESDQKAVMARVLKDLGIDERQVPPKQALQRVHAEKREGRGPRDAEGAEISGLHLAEIYARYQAALSAANSVDFEDLLLHVMRIVENPESSGGRELRQRFDHVLVDEFQDTNLVQYRIVRALAAESRNLCVVGDDDQSIYSWRGADVRLIRGFRRDFPDASVVKLEQNYRSTGNIVAAALGVIAPALDREPKQLWTAEPGGDPVRVRQVEDERAEAAFVVRTIRDEVGRGTRADRIAVFYRIHAQSRVLEEALRGENVAYQVIGGMRFFERAEVKDIVAYLRLVDNPRSDADLLRIINVPARGIGDKTIQKLLDTAARRSTSVYDAILPTLEEGVLGAAARNKLVAFHELTEDLRRASAELGPRRLAELVLEQTGYRKVLRDADNAESDARLENLEELVASIGEYEDDAIEAGEEPSLSGYLERVTLASAVDTMKDQPLVSLMTVHAAKGLEFDVVLLTGMEEETFPYRGMREGDSDDDFGEERRLAYVAVTRARKRLIISHALQRTLFGFTRYAQPSRFIDDLPREVIRFERSTPDRTRADSGARAGYAGPATFRPSAGSSRKPSWSAGNWGGDRAGSATGARGATRSSPPPSSPGERFVDRSYFDDGGTAGHDAPSASGEEPVRRGSRVRHRRFGEGVVEELERGNELTIVARFPGFGVRRVLARFLELG